MMESKNERLSETEGQGGTGIAAGMEDEEEEEEEILEMPMGTAQPRQETDDRSLVVLNEFAVRRARPRRRPRDRDIDDGHHH
jgi:hypothetical protein